MATIRLIPSTYYLSSSSYLSVSSASNMYDNTDSTTYATVTNSRASTSSYYIYVRGFNFDDVPSGAIINSFTVKVKCNYSGGYAQAMYLYDGTSTSMGSSDSISSSVTTHTFTCNYSWDDIVAAGADFGIRINCRRSSRNTTSYVYIYGAEILVDYTMPVSATVTSTLTGNGTIDPSGAYSTYEDTEYTLTITPTDKSATVTATKDGSDITSQLVAHGAETSANRVLGEYTLVSGSFNSGESWFEGRTGEGHDTTDTTTTNYYSGSSSTQAVFTYDVGFDLPSNTNITRVYAIVNAHAESNSNSSEYMCFQLISGSTELSEEINFKSISTSNTNYTLECDTLPTASQIADMKLRCKLGYYGGALNGATVYVEYDVSGGTVDHYTYTYTVTGDATIAVTIGGASTPPVITVDTPTRTIISDESGYDQCVCTFSSDLALQAWEARATKSGVTPARGVGLLVESGGALAAGATGTIYVENEELTQGDGDYTITVYGQSTGGIWSQ